MPDLRSGQYKDLRTGNASIRVAKLLVIPPHLGKHTQLGVIHIPGDLVNHELLAGLESVLPLPLLVGQRRAEDGAGLVQLEAGGAGGRPVCNE